MKRMHDTPQLAELFVKAGLVAALAAVLLLPMTVKTNGNEAAQQVGQALPMLKRTAWEGVRLPPIPHLETMPWLMREQVPKRLKIDTLLSPKLEMMEPAIAWSADGAAPVAERRAGSVPRPFT